MECYFLRDFFRGVMYSVHGDESADEKKQRVFAIAGLLGHDSDRSTFKAKWFERTDGKIFHAAQCESDSGEFDTSSHEDNLKLYADLTNIIARSNLLGIGIAISLKDYRELIASALDEDPYYLVFVSVITRLARQAAI